MTPGRFREPRAPSPCKPRPAADRPTVPASRLSGVSMAPSLDGSPGWGGPGQAPGAGDGRTAPRGRLRAPGRGQAGSAGAGRVRLRSRPMARPASLSVTPPGSARADQASGLAAPS